jgi:hypothetical protein
LVGEIESALIVSKIVPMTRYRNNDWLQTSGLASMEKIFEFLNRAFDEIVIDDTR